MINKFLYKLQMLYDDRIEVAEAIYVSKTSASKERDIYYYWYFLDNGFQFQRYTCNGFHEVLAISFNLNGIAVYAVLDKKRC